MRDRSAALAKFMAEDMMRLPPAERARRVGLDWLDATPEERQRAREIAAELLHLDGLSEKLDVAAVRERAERLRTGEGFLP